MILPAFLQPLQTVTLANPPVEAAATGAMAEARSLIGFSVQYQQQTEWCWAAVSTSVAAFFGQTSWTQCGIAEAELSPLNCCGADASAGCNQPWYLDRALARVGHFDHMNASNVSFSAMQDEINQGCPLCCRIAWLGGGAHFIAVGEWLIAADGTRYVGVQDPYLGPMQKKYAEFVSAYTTPGDLWTHSYFTLATAAAIVAEVDPSVNSPKSA